MSVLLQNPNFFANVICTDYFADALEVAKKNYELLITNGLKLKAQSLKKVEFIQSDLLNFLFQAPYNSELLTINSELILVANLPYIPEETFKANVADNVKKWEPKPAFVGGDD
jgi:methylase of polypeptide subunit release factors